MKVLNFSAQSERLGFWGVSNGLGDDAPTVPAKELCDYWDSMPKKNGIPFRKDVDPRQLGTCIGFAFIAELPTHGPARFRVVGGHLNELAGMDVRGMPVSSLVEDRLVDEVTAAVDQVFLSSCIWRAHIQSSAAIGQPALAADIALLPLRDDAGNVTRAIGVWHTEGTIGETPRVFDRVFISECVQIDGADTGHETRGLAEDQSPWTQRPSGTTRLGRPHLQVLEGGKA